MANPAEEVLEFLSPTADTRLRCVALQYVLGLTGSPDGCSFLCSGDKYLKAIATLLRDPSPAVAKDAFLCIVNLATDQDRAWKLLRLTEPSVLQTLGSYILTPDSEFADIACTALSNLSRHERCARKIVDELIMFETDTSDLSNPDAVDKHVTVESLISAFCQIPSFNTKGNNLNYIGPFLSNITQIQEARGFVLGKQRCVIQRLLPFTEYKQSAVRRGGVVGTLRNCCFETGYHSWLLSDAVDLLPCLLLPLAGPEEFDDDDMSRLPDELQYLEPDKEREEDPDIRAMLVETVHQLCATQECRKLIKDKNTYVILRELHTWERDPRAKAAELKLIELLIADEPEPGMEDLTKVDIPDNVVESLEKARIQEEKEIAEEEKTLQEQEKPETTSDVASTKEGDT